MRRSTRRPSRLSERRRSKPQRGGALISFCPLSLPSREIKQKNEGQLIFQWDEERSPGNIILEVELSRHLDSSLIDVDVHPTYVSIVIKNKVSE
jgi:hypothetical protein